MRKKSIFLLTMIFVLGLTPIDFSNAENLSTMLKGKILLQVEDVGQAWYIDPDTSERAFLGRPDDAFRIMRELGLGISEKDYNSFAGYASSRLAGKILLRVEAKGEAYYVFPDDLKMYYLGRPADAFIIMREKGFGITNDDLNKVPVFQKYKEQVDKNTSTIEEFGGKIEKQQNKIDDQQQAIEDLQKQIQQNSSTATTIPLSLPIPSVVISTPSVLPTTSSIPATPATPTTPDITAPIITNIQVTSITEISATITWTTNEASNSAVNYTTISTASSTIDILQSSNTTNHSVTLSGLVSGTTHYFTVSSTDATGNTAESNEQSFITVVVAGSDALSILQATQFDVRASTTGPAGEDMWTTGMQYSMMIYTTCPSAADVRVGLLYAKESTSSINETNINGIVGVISGHKCSETNQLNPDGTESFRLYNLPSNTSFNYQVVFFKPEVSYWPPLALSTHPELTELDLDARKIYTDDDKANEIYRVPAGSFTTPVQ
jgi:hypothetical protein